MSQQCKLLGSWQKSKSVSVRFRRKYDVFASGELCSPACLNGQRPLIIALLLLLRLPHLRHRHLPSYLRWNSSISWRSNCNICHRFCWHTFHRCNDSEGLQVCDAVELQRTGKQGGGASVPYTYRYRIPGPCSYKKIIHFLICLD